MPGTLFRLLFQTKTAVWPDLLDRAPVTFSLAAGASILWLIGGVTVGIISALRRGFFFDRAAMSIALGGVSLPIFFTGLMCLAFFSYRWHIFASGGSYTPITENPASWAYNLLLPWITLAFLFSAQYAQLTHAGMLETMSEDYIRTARARAYRTGRHPQARLARRADPDPHDLRPRRRAAPRRCRPHRETFSLNGLGKYTVDAIGNQDLPGSSGSPSSRPSSSSCPTSSST